MPIIAPPKGLGTVQPSNIKQRGLDVQFSADSFGAGLGRALTSFGGALEVIQERKKATGRFDQMSAYSEFETDVKMSVEELKRDTTLDEAQFFEQADSLYEEKRASYLNRVPTEYQQEFEARTSQFKQSVVLDAFEFGNKQRDLFYTTKINEQLEKNKIDLDANPERLEEVRAALHQQIVATDLPDIEQEAEIAKADVALEAVAYKNKIKTAKATSLARPAGGMQATNLPPIAGGILNAIAVPESGGRYDIRYGGAAGAQKVNSFADHPRIGAVIASGPHAGQKSTASGKYQFIDSTWDAAARGAGVTDFSPASQDRAGWYWAQKTIQEITGKTVNELVSSGDFKAIKRALGTQWEGVKKMSFDQFMEAFTDGGQSLADYSDINSDSAFSNLTLESRDALTADAEREATLNFNSLLKQQEVADNQRINEVMVGILDGSHGRVDVDNLRKEGILTDFADINRAYSLIDAQVDDLTNYQLGNDRYENGGIWDAKNSDHKKQANAMFGEDGVTAVNARDEDYITDVAIPRFAKMSMLPPDMTGLLYAGTQGGNVDQAAYGYNSLARLREANPVAFENQVSEQIVKELDAWETGQNKTLTEENLNRVQNRAETQAERQEAKIFETEARELLKDFDVVEEVLDSVNGGLLGFGSFGLTEESLIPGQRVGLMNDYSQIFTEEYKRYRDVDKAKAATLKSVNKIWGVTDIGGKPQFMRTPPEKAGYKPVKGNYDWIKKQVFKRIGMPAPQWVEFISDKQTQQEANAYKTGVEGAIPPTYRITYMGANGIIRSLTNASGDVIRMNFEFDDKLSAADEEEFIKLRDQAAAEDEAKRQQLQGLRTAPIFDTMDVDPTRRRDAIQGRGGNIEVFKP